MDEVSVTPPLGGLYFEWDDDFPMKFSQYGLVLFCASYDCESKANVIKSFRYDEALPIVTNVLQLHMSFDGHVVVALVGLEVLHWTSSYSGISPTLLKAKPFAFEFDAKGSHGRKSVCWETKMYTNLELSGMGPRLLLNIILRLRFMNIP